MSKVQSLSIIVDSCYKIDITEEFPTWRSIAAQPTERKTPRGGLIAHRDKTRDINVLFQMPLNACPSNGGEHPIKRNSRKKLKIFFSDVYVYNIVNDTWTSIPALISPKNAM